MTIENRQIDLTDEEWLKLINGNREDSELPICCGNVSELRDDLIAALRNGGRVLAFNQVKMHIGWVFPEHDITPVMSKVAKQLDVDIVYSDHESQGIEV